MRNKLHSDAISRGTRNMPLKQNRCRRGKIRRICSSSLTARPILILIELVTIAVLVFFCLELDRPAFLLEWYRSQSKQPKMLHL
eukprot:1531252-Amphidinium_carterae.1